MQDHHSATNREEHVSNEDIIRALGRIEGGMEELKSGQSHMLTEQRATNGHVRDLREWRAVHDAQTEARISAWREQRQNMAEMANHVQSLMDLERTRAERARTSGNREKRYLAYAAVVAALIGGIGVSLFNFLKVIFRGR